MVGGSRLEEWPSKQGGAGGGGATLDPPIQDLQACAVLAPQVSYPSDAPEYVTQFTPSDA